MGMARWLRLRTLSRQKLHRQNYATLDRSQEQGLGPPMARKIPMYTHADMIFKAIIEERERCAQIVETMTGPSAYAVVVDVGKVIAAEIRNPSA